MTSVQCVEGEICLFGKFVQQIDLKNCQLVKPKQLEKKSGAIRRTLMVSTERARFVMKQLPTVEETEEEFKILRKSPEGT